MNQEAEAASWYKTPQSDGTQLKLSLHSTSTWISSLLLQYELFFKAGGREVFFLSV